MECLIKIVGHQNEGFRTTDYLLSLLEMDISFHSIEVINGLSAVIDLPPQFLNSYITNCISSCENMKDKFVQVR